MSYIIEITSNDGVELIPIVSEKLAINLYEGCVLVLGKDKVKMYEADKDKQSN